MTVFTSTSRMGYGLMNFTWTPKPTSDAQAFKAMKTAIDGGMTFFNAGEFYGQPKGTENLELLARFFEAEPTYADKVYISVKGGLGPGFKPDSSLEGLRKSVTNINQLLKHRKMDQFESARVDQTRSIEEAMENLKVLAGEGHFKHIGLSEVSEKSIRAAHKVVPELLAQVEVEYSPWSLDVESNGVLSTCAELGVTLVAYAPLGRGFLTGTLRSPDDIPEGDMRKHHDRFQPENFAKNLELVDKLAAVAERKKVTSAELVLAWILAQNECIMPIPGSTRPAGVKEAIAAAKLHLSTEELAEIRHIVDSAQVIGHRYNDQMKHTLSV